MLVIQPQINFLINPISHWKIILIFSAIQLLTILLWGWIVKIYISNKYSSSHSEYALFKSNEYNSLSDYNLLQYPSFSLVLVRYNSDKTIKSETFYTKLGDWIYFKYENERKYYSSSLLISSYILILFNILSILAFLSLIVLDTVKE